MQLQDMQRPLYMRPQDALQYNIIDEIIQPNQAKQEKAEQYWIKSGRAESDNRLEQWYEYLSLQEEYALKDSFRKTVAQVHKSADGHMHDMGHVIHMQYGAGRPSSRPSLTPLCMMSMVHDGADAVIWHGIRFMVHGTSSEVFSWQAGVDGLQLVLRLAC